jgi:tetratricopeptide (TPR) repeat protein
LAIARPLSIRGEKSTFGFKNLPEELMEHGPQLDELIHSQITELSAGGNALADRANYSDAMAKFVQAIQLLPEPHQQWEAATWLWAAIGDMHFLLGDAEKTMQCFVNAVHCPGGLGNPFIHLRLGQACFDLGDLDKAADELTRAYMGAGMDIFMQDDPKYLEFLETKIEL